MKKILNHVPLVLINLPGILINISLVGIKAYSHNPIAVAPQYIICTVGFYIIWLIYGFLMGKKSEKSFLYFSVLYWGITLATLIFASKHSILSLFALFNVIPQYSAYALLDNLGSMSSSTSAIIIVFMPVLVSFIGFYIGIVYKTNSHIKDR